MLKILLIGGAVFLAVQVVCVIAYFLLERKKQKIQAEINRLQAQ